MGWKLINVPDVNDSVTSDEALLEIYNSVKKIVEYLEPIVNEIKSDKSDKDRLENEGGITAAR